MQCKHTDEERWGVTAVVFDDRMSSGSFEAAWCSGEGKHRVTQYDGLNGVECGRTWEWAMKGIESGNWYRRPALLYTYATYTWYSR